MLTPFTFLLYLTSFILIARTDADPEPRSDTALHLAAAIVSALTMGAIVSAAVWAASMLGW